MKKEKNVLYFLYQAGGRSNWGIVLLAVLESFLGASSILFIMFMRTALDGAINQQRELFWKYLLLLIGLTLLQLLCSGLATYLEEKTSSSIENRIKDRLFKTLLEKSYADVTKTHSGEWMNRLTSDASIAANSMVGILPDFLGTIIRLAAALVMILYLERNFFFLLVPGGLLMVLFTYGFRNYMKRLHKNVQEADGELRVFLSERLGRLMMLKAFQIEEKTRTEAQKKMQKHQNMRMKRNHFSNFCGIGFSGAMNGIYLLGFTYCGYGILQGTVSYGTLVAILQLIGQIQGPFASLSGYVSRYFAMSASVERLMEAEAYPEEEKSEDLPSDFTSFYEKEFRKIEAENISFCYPQKEPLMVFERVSLSIKKGDYIAFTGESGCGKSTLFKLLLCLYPLQQGGFFIQTEQKEYPLSADWRALFAYVPQENQLMTGTIREAVALSKGEETCDEKRLWTALKIACADEFVKELEQGLDTMLGERGAGLSEGQMQRLAIARAIYTENPVLLLDEATSALDEETEKAVLENLKKMTDRTVLLVTHRPAALNICNRILQFTQSGIVEQRDETKR